MLYNRIWLIWSTYLNLNNFKVKGIHIGYVKKLNSKRIIDEEKENESDSENNDFKNKNKNSNNDKYDDFNFDINNNIEKEKDKDDDFNYLFNSEKKNNLRNFGLKDNFRKEVANKNNDEMDYLFNEKKSKEDKYDDLFKKNNEKDFSNIDSEINKILSKDIPLKNNNNINLSNRKYNNFRSNNNLNNNDFGSNLLKFKSQKISHNNNINGLELDKPYEISNLKPVNVGRRAGGGLKALGYEPNKKSIFDDLNFGGGLGLNRKKETNNNKFGYGYKKDLGPIILKEKKNDNFYGFNSNREDKYGSMNNGNGNNNNFYGKKDKFSLYEKNNPLFNQFNNDIIGNSRRKRNFYSSPNNLGWDI